MNKKKIAIFSALAPLAMFGMAFAGVPLYKIFCEKTGYGGKVTVAKGAASGISETKINVAFDSNVMPELKWTFKPSQKNAQVRLGENVLAFYKIKNNTNEPITGIAEYNVTPHKAALYFQKLECFCFTNQTLQPGQEVELPVLFYVDPRIGTDKHTQDVKDITLSYTFMRVKEETKAAEISSKVKTKS